MRHEYGEFVVCSRRDPEDNLETAESRGQMLESARERTWWRNEGLDWKYGSDQ
jgi:hypothetical protein